MQMLTCKYCNIYCTEVAEPEACGVHLYTEGVEASAEVDDGLGARVVERRVPDYHVVGAQYQ